MHVCVYMYTRVYVCICMHMYAHVFLRIYARVCLVVCVCVHIWGIINTYEHALLSFIPSLLLCAHGILFIHTCMYIFICVCVFACVCVFVIRKRSFTPIHACVYFVSTWNTYFCIYICEYIHIYMCVCVCMIGSVGGRECIERYPKTVRRYTK